MGGCDGCGNWGSFGPLFMTFDYLLHLQNLRVIVFHCSHRTKIGCGETTPLSL